MEIKVPEGTEGHTAICGGHTRNGAPCLLPLYHYVYGWDHGNKAERDHDPVPINIKEPATDTE